MEERPDLGPTGLSQPGGIQTGARQLLGFRDLLLLVAPQRKLQLRFRQRLDAIERLEATQGAIKARLDVDRLGAAANA